VRAIIAFLLSNIFWRRSNIHEISRGLVKAQIHYTSFSAASPWHCQVRNKLARAKVRCVCCVALFPKLY